MELISDPSYLRPPRGVCGACLHQVHKPCAIGAIPSHRFVMELLQWHKVCEIGGEELHRPPVVALSVILRENKAVYPPGKTEGNYR